MIDEVRTWTSSDSRSVPNWILSDGAGARSFETFSVMRLVLSISYSILRSVFSEIKKWSMMMEITPPRNAPTPSSIQSIYYKILPYLIKLCNIFLDNQKSPVPKKSLRKSRIAVRHGHRCPLPHRGSPRGVWPWTGILDFFYSGTGGQGARPLGEPPLSGERGAPSQAPLSAQPDDVSRKPHPPCPEDAGINHACILSDRDIRPAGICRYPA